MNVFDYLKWRGDVPLSVAPFNEVDNLILSELAYTDFSGIVPESGQEVPLREAYEAYFSSHTREEIQASKSFTARSPLLMEPMCSGARFGDMKLTAYRDERNTQADLQFSAVTFLLSDGSAYAAFRGTDGTLVGWKEDFLFSYLSGTEGQQRAAEYLRRDAGEIGRPLRAGGHSKGGNLAVYAAACCGEETQDRLTAVYSNDGPGFRLEFLAGEEYQRIVPKIVSIVPDTSVIGLLMDSSVRPRVVRSTASGIMQHDGFSWETERDRFAEAKLSETSKMLRQMLSGWLDQMDDGDRKELTETIFGLLSATGENTFSGISESRWKSLEAMAASALKLPKENLQEMGRYLTQLGKSGGKTVSALLQSRVAELLRTAGSILPQAGAKPEKIEQP